MRYEVLNTRYEVKIQPIKLSRYKYYTCLYFRPYTYYTYCLSFECTRHIAFVIFFFQSLALVVLLLTLCKSYDYLCQPFFIDEHTNRNYGKAGVFRTTLQLVQFFLEQLAARAPYYISAYPNAGLPNSLGTYDQTPAEMADEIREYIHEGLVNIIGGCCGTTDEYIAAYSSLIVGAVPRIPASLPDNLWLSGLELLEVKPENNFINVGRKVFNMP
jgi:hypothetical protein